MTLLRLERVNCWIVEKLDRLICRPRFAAGRPNLILFKNCARVYVRELTQIKTSRMQWHVSGETVFPNCRCISWRRDRLCCDSAQWSRLRIPLVAKQVLTIQIWLFGSGQPCLHGFPFRSTTLSGGGGEPVQRGSRYT